MEKIISIATPIFAMVSFFLGYYFNMLIEKSKIKKELSIKYLNGLRLYLEEVYYRLHEINESINKEGSCRALTIVKNIDDIKNQRANWFVNEGCYLISTSYLIACLFGTIEKLRDEYPYITIKGKDDTLILNKAFKINLAFLKDLSIYYVLQHNIGQIMYKKAEERLLNYAEFTEVITDDKMSIWFERLLIFVIAIGEGKKRENIHMALNAIKSLSNYIEKEYKFGPAIEKRLEMEASK